MEESSNSKYVLFFVLLLTLAGALYYFYYFQGSREVVAPTSSTSAVTYMTGRITEVRGSSILVVGNVGGEEKTMEFIITPETFLKKSVLKITAEQAKSGESFAPEQADVVGEFADLKKDEFVRVKTVDDIATASVVNATEINYTAYDLPF